MRTSFEQNELSLFLKELPLFSVPDLISKDTHELVTADNKVYGIYNQGWYDSIKKGLIETDYGVQRGVMGQKYGSGRFLHSEFSNHYGDAFDEVTLSNVFLNQYYSQVSNSTYFIAYWSMIYSMLFCIS